MGSIFLLAGITLPSQNFPTIWRQTVHVAHRLPTVIATDYSCNDGLHWLVWNAHKHESREMSAQQELQTIV